ncbi:hypothetical protein TNCV_1367001 [Trichonephila clavipes]|nr:hypothetical protein TNCV_1367001 [Trichonephila clavipes]
MTTSVVNVAAIAGYDHLGTESKSVAADGVSPARCCASTDPMFLIGDRSEEQAGQGTIQWDGTSVAMHNATVLQPLTMMFPNSNPTIVMLQAEIGFFRKHNVVQFRCACPPFIAPLAAQTPAVSSQG